MDIQPTRQAMAVVSSAAEGNAITGLQEYVSASLFEGLCSVDTGQALIDAHISQRVLRIADPVFAEIDLDIPEFIALIRDRVWHSDNEIEFFADEREGRSSTIWSKSIRRGGALTLDTILNLKANKTSIYVKRLELMRQSMREIAQRLAYTGYFKPTISAMYSPAGALSTKIHIDPCDVIAIQLHGTKRWTVDSKPAVENVHLGQTKVVPDDGEFAEQREFETRAGEALLIPRGYFHNAKVEDEESLHLVLSLFPLTWFDVVSQQLQGLCDTDPAFRASIIQAGANGQAIIDPQSAASILSGLGDPEKLKSASAQAMKQRAQEHMLNSYGQVFAKPDKNLP